MATSALKTDSGQLLLQRIKLLINRWREKGIVSIIPVMSEFLLMLLLCSIFTILGVITNNKIYCDNVTGFSFSPSSSLKPFNQTLLYYISSSYS